MPHHPSNQSTPLMPGTAFTAAFFLLQFHSARTVAAAGGHAQFYGVHKPFGYQSDSTQSEEYKNANARRSHNDRRSLLSVAPMEPGHVEWDPSAFAGAAHYDPIHHALYVTGATYASTVFDGGDSYQPIEEVADIDAHSGDLGRPDHSPLQAADCFYAVLGLPSNDGGDPGAGGGNNSDGNGKGEAGRAKLLHARRFGTSSAQEACSALDVMHAEHAPEAPGGYAHPFDTATSVALRDRRSVRLLMAGGVESPNGRAGYVVSDLKEDQYGVGRVFAFAQMVDVLLPSDDDDRHQQQGNHTIGEKSSYFLLHQGEYWNNSDIAGAAESKNMSQRAVASRVDARALLNDQMPADLVSLAYPVAVVADPTSKSHYYAVLLTSVAINDNYATIPENVGGLRSDPTIGQGAVQRNRADRDDFDQETQRSRGDFFGQRSRPRYGSDYRIVVKKVAIANMTAACPDGNCYGLSPAEDTLAGTTLRGEKLVMQHAWYQEFAPQGEEDARPSAALFAPSGDESGEGDVLVIAGSTSGYGNAFGLTVDSGGEADAMRFDLDGFVTKLRTDTGAFSGKAKFDTNLTNHFANMHSIRVASNPGKDDVVAGLCARPLRTVGPQRAVTHVYAVGTTAAILPAQAGKRRKNSIPTGTASATSDSVEAFLMKISLATMKVVWTVQVGAVVVPERLRKGKCTGVEIEMGYDECTQLKGDALGYGCAVTPDGSDVYLTGLVKEGGAVRHFTDEDDDTEMAVAHGGTDVFVASYQTINGARTFLRQFGSDEDDAPSRQGGVTADQFGNALITGNTRGSLMRKRAPGEYRFGEAGTSGAADVFVMSVVGTTGDHAPAFGDPASSPHHPANDAVWVSQPPATIPPPPAPRTPPAPRAPPTTPRAPVGTPPVGTPPVGNAAEENEGGGGGSGLSGVGIAGISMFTVVLIAAFFVVNVQGKKKGLMKRFRENNKRRFGNASADSGDPDMMVEVRNSGSGGWHGVYDYSQPRRGLGGGGGGLDTHATSTDSDGVLSLFMEDGLAEIENSLDLHGVGCTDDDVSEADLIRAYNDAYSQDVEPEKEDEPFQMPSMGSTNPFGTDDYDDHVIC